MEDLPTGTSGIDTSLTINSVLKPAKPRIPLKELMMSAAHEDDNTAARKRRVSFANVNKIKEFSAGAESMVVCHTPAYEEPFSMSSDSSCPSGVDGWTPAKGAPYNCMQPNYSSIQNENDSRPLFTPRNIGFAPTENNVLSHHSTNFSQLGMDLTNCTNRGSIRNSTRFSGGMDLTEGISPAVDYSRESMNMTRGGVYQSNQQFMCQTSMNTSDSVSRDDSDALEFTDAIINPRFSLASTRYTASNMDMTRNLYSVNNTRYSQNGMDLTKGAMSPCSSVGRASTRYSLSNMDLTEAIGSDCSGFELTDVISEPKIVSTRYSVNDMDLTEAVTRLDLTSLSSNSTENTSRDNVECSVTSEQSIDLIKRISNSRKFDDTNIVPNTTNLMEHINAESRPSYCYSLNMDSLELNDSDDKSEDTPTTQTYTGILPLSATKTESGGRELTVQEEFSVERSKLETKINDGTFEANVMNNKNIIAIEENFSKQQFIGESSFVQLESTASCKDTEKFPSNDEVPKENNIPIILETTSCRNLEETNQHLNKSCLYEECSELNVTKSVCKNNQLPNIMEPKIYSPNRDEKDNYLYLPDVESEILLKPNEMLEKENTFKNDESMDVSDSHVLSYGPINRKSLNPIDMKNIESRNDVIEMDISSPAKTITDKECSVSNESLKQVGLPSDSGVRCSIFPVKSVPQIIFDDDDKMSVSFSESKLEKQVEDCVVEGQKFSLSSNGTENPVEGVDEIHKNEEINQEMFECENVQSRDQLESLETESIHVNKTCDDKYVEETVKENTKQIENSLNNLSVSSDLMMNVSTNNTHFGKNITMTHGGTSRQSIIPHESTFETSKDDSIRGNVYDEASELESSLPLIQRMEKLKKSVDASEVHLDKSRDTNILQWKEKGGKRSFEIALEPENDTEESPVKQICLPNAIQIQDSECLSNISVPSFLMDNIHHDSVPSLHQSEINISMIIETNSARGANVDVNLGRKSLSQNNHITSINVEEHSVCDENNFSLNVDVSTNHFNSRSQSHIDNESIVQRKQADEESISRQRTNLTCTSDQFISDSQLDRHALHCPKVVERQPHSPQKSSLQQNILSKSNKNIDICNKIYESDSNQFQNTPAVTLKAKNTYRKGGIVTKLGEGGYSYNLIPRWIEIQFGVMPNGNIFNISYNIVCSEEEQGIGEYLLRQVSTMLQESKNLTTITKEPHDSFFLHLPKNISHICKYYGGTLKGNVLTLDVVSCKQKFWTFVDVNIKYPKFLSAEDITISEQRIGELKLSTIRKIFGTIERGNDQLLNFAVALNDLQY